MTIQTAPHTYDLLVIGRGSAAAIYLNTLRRRHVGDLSGELPALGILVIGRPDPWKGERGYAKGHYTEKINQARQLFEHGNQPKASMLDTPVDRQAWARQNADIIEEMAQGNVLDAEVIAVRKDRSGQVGDAFLVETSGHGSYRAKKVVVATGAGIEQSERQYHEVPDEVAAFRRAGHVQNARIMDLDQFQRGDNASKEGKGKAVGVIGPAAGTDAIMEAATRGYRLQDVFWFISRGEPGIKLTWDVRESGITPTFTAAEAGKAHPQGCVLNYDSLSIEVGGRRAVKVVLNAGRSFEVDYLVYAVGQRGGGVNRPQANAGTGKMDQVPFVEGPLALEPVYDVDQRFGEQGAPGSGGAWQHVLGLQVAGTTERSGLIVVGAAAAQAARGIAHNYLDADYQALIGRLDELTMDFRIVADQCGFRALFASTRFAEMVTSDLTSQDDPHYDELGRAYVREVQTRLNTDINKVLGKLDESQYAIKVKHADNCRKLAAELCYLFCLRVKAARYYAKTRDATPSALLSAGLKRSLPETVADSRLIGGMQRNIAALNQHDNLAHIRNARGINFLEDQQTLALYVATHYPNIPAPRLNALVEEIVTARKDKLRGFSAQEMGVWDYRLGAADREGRKALGFAYKTYFS